MTDPTPKTQDALPTRSEHLGLGLPLTTEHFLSLEAKQQNDLVSEQVMDWVPYEIESECSQSTPGAQWIPGGEYYALTATVMVPPALLEKEDEDLFEWLEYSPRAWVSDIGAAIRLFEAIEQLRPAFYKSTPSETLPWEWCCHFYQPLTGKAYCFNGCVAFKDAPRMIALTALEAIGVIDDEPLANKNSVCEVIRERLLQVWSHGSTLVLDYSPEHYTWKLTETLEARADREASVSTLLVRWRQGAYQFEPCDQERSQHSCTEAQQGHDPIPD